MVFTLAFDVYGTLIDTHGLVAILETMTNKDAKAFSLLWRNKQLEYSFRRGLMQNYQPFEVCTRQALEFTCKAHNVELTSHQKSVLLEGYNALPAFSDVVDTLSELKQSGHRLFAFSNGSKDTVDSLLMKAGLREHFVSVVSCADLYSFKPNPAVYSHFLRESASVGSNAWLISSNAFDVTGAISSGMRAVWVKRAEDHIFDPWEIEPTVTISKLSDLTSKLLLKDE